MKTAPARPSDKHAGLPPGRRRTSHLEGAELDAAVAMAEGLRPHNFRGAFRCVTVDAEDETIDYEPSTDWNSGGPIIDREHITIEARRDGAFFAGDWIEGPHWLARMPGHFNECGATALQAAMRTYVAAKLGPEVTLP